MLKRPVSADGPINLRDIDCGYSNDLRLQRLVEDRGVPPSDGHLGVPLRRAASS